jgi:hypothetical protein
MVKAAAMRQDQKRQQSIGDSFNRTMETLRRQKVGAMVAAGQCDQARATALSAGDFELAVQVNSICQPLRCGAKILPHPSA